MNNWDATALRRIAADILRKVAEKQLAQDQHHDCLVSIVRQWQTYDGHAMLYLPGQAILIRLTTTADGWNVSGKAKPDWLGPTLRTWNIPPGCLADVTARLNLCQSAEVVSADGNLLRLWSNPRQQQHGVEYIDEAPAPRAEEVRELGELAAWYLEEQLGAGCDADERGLLVEALVRQWQHYQGQACLFVGADVQLVLVRKTDRFGEGRRVASTKVAFPIRRALLDLGFLPEATPEVIRRLNCSEPVEFREGGEPWVLWYDVPQRLLRSAPRAAVATPSGSVVPTPRSALPLGQIEIESGAAAALAAAGQDVSPFLRRHAAGDRGAASADSRCASHSTWRKPSGFLRSVYYTARGAQLIVNTLPERTCTVVSYPDPRLAEALVRAAQPRRDS